MMMRVLIFLCLCGAVAIPVRAETEVSSSVATNAPDKSLSGEDAAAEVTPPSRIPTGDPFAMQGLADDDGFINAGPAAIPQGIRVVGILSIAGKAPVGALSVPGASSIHFVCEGDIIQIDSPAGSGVTGATDAQLYLLVKSVTASQVEIAPRTRPQDVRIYR